MAYFRKKCPECGKDNPVGRPDAPGFCNRVCETNYRYREQHTYKMNLYRDK